MENRGWKLFWGIVVFGLLSGISPHLSCAEVSSNTIANFTSVPINLTENDVTPQVMINASNDHQLFFKAYNDYSDLDDDGIAETTYKHSVDYYGYFDSNKCYAYDAADARFEPKAVTADKYCTGANDAYWSGNFLNWATMSRIDAIRKMLFGGHRRVDTSTDTVLERAFLPPDIHSFAKHYAGADVASLTPYTPNTAAPTGTSVTSRAIGTGSKGFTTQTGNWIQLGDYLTILHDATHYMQGWVTAFNSGTGALTVDVVTAVGGTTENSWNITNHTRVGLTICNTTAHVVLGGPAANDMSQTVTDPPLIRVAAGNYAFWSAGEVNQCLWENEDGNNVFRGGNGMNWNNPALSGIAAAQDRPDKTAVGGAPYGDFVARVQVCVPGLLGKEKCKQYPKGNYKPIGLLQVYGDDSQLQFGMVAGTYGKARSGGDIVTKIKNLDGLDGMCREINLGIDCDGDGNVDDDLDDATHDVGDGTFKKVYQSAGGPITLATKSEGIINTWSLYRIYGYKYGDWNYNSNAPGDKCPLAVNFFGVQSDSECHNWGNPFGEIYMSSLRYFAGENAPLAYQSGDGQFIEGINYNTGTWSDPLTTANYCARLNIVNFNSSVSTTDTAYAADPDELDTASFGVVKDLDSTQTSKQLTDIIGQYEGIHGQSWFVGENGTDNNHRCTPKTITSLGDARGLCPEGPDLRGGFRIAGLAYYAHVNDIRPSTLTGGRALTGTQKVDTYAVKMATGSPIIEIPVPGSATGQKVTLLPSCIDNNKADYGCTMVDFKIIQPHTVVGGVGTGKFLVIWEDSLQGNDYDLDAGGTISYTITPTQITISTAITLQNLGYSIGHGYVISGTTQDGLHIHSGTNTFDYNDPTAIVGCEDGDGCSQGDGVSSRTYTIGASSAGLLQDPLWYAAKWGGFIDSNENKRPDLQSEWDKEDNNTGDDIPDGIPDNYFYATNPVQLENSLNRVFQSILQRASSGTAAAVVSNNVSGIGALYQAYYEPLRQDTLGNQATWLGTVQALWLDSYGYVREDDGDAALEGYNIDKVIQLFYDEVENKTRVRRYISTKDDEFSPYYMQGKVLAYDAVTGIVQFDVEEIGGAVGVGPFSDWTVYNTTASKTGSSTTSATMTAVGGVPQTFAVSPATAWINIGDTVMVAHFDSTIIELADVGTLWNARKQLSFSGADASVQRSFAVQANGAVNGGRFIKTWIDADGDSVVDAGEFVDFARTAIAPSNFGFFNLATEAEAENLADYVRGKEIAGYRSRTIDYDGNGSTEVLRLADVVNSTPTVVGAPQEEFDLLYKDVSYAVFKKQYAKRRQVLYAGSNGGMLHAFNGGFYDSAETAFLVSGKKYDGVTPVVEHPLGAEIWSYVPMNLLPHLKWLKDLSYTHVYYVDGKPKVFDAKIFTKDADHPGLPTDTKGWGTVLVVGMRFGGGPMTIDTAADGLTVDATPVDNREFRSAYIIMDITNPEAEPKLLAEIQMPNGSYCTSYPAALAVKDKDTGLDANKWFLTFGSGPTNLVTAESATTAKIYAFDLEEITTPGASAIVTPPAGCTQLALGTGGSMKILSCDTMVANSFIGDPISVDWDLNYKAESIYFGVVGNKTATSGRVMRLGIHEEESQEDWEPLATLINTSQPVVAGVTPGSDESGQKWIFFGTGRFFVSADQASTATQSIYGVKDAGSEVVKTDLLDVSNAQVEVDGDLTGVGAIPTVDVLRDTIASSYDGWYLNLPPIQGDVGIAPATRVINSSALAGGVLFTTAYQPGIDACSGEGFSRLYGLYYKTGTAYSSPTVFGTEVIDGVEYSKAFIELGYGFATTPSLHTGSGTGDDAVSVFTQLSTGAIARTEASTVTGVRSGMESWIEVR